MAHRLIVLFRNDLRLHDNPLLAVAAERVRQRLSEEVLPVYCFDPRQFDLNRLDVKRPLYGGPKTSLRRGKFLLEAVIDLKRSLRAVRSDLLVAVGHTEDVVTRFLSRWGNVVLAQEEVTSEEASLEHALHRSLKDLGRLELHWGSTLFHIDDIPFDEDFRDFPMTPAPFLDRVVQQVYPDLAIDVRNPFGDVRPGSLPLPADPAIQEACQFSPEFTDLPFHSDIKSADPPTPHPLASYHFKGGLEAYSTCRDELYGGHVSSKLSPWLATGCLSPRRVWREILMFEKKKRVNKSTTGMKNTLALRDWTRFVAHKCGSQIFSSTGVIGKGSLSRFQWERNPEVIQRWKDGQTGVPFVDAAMRELKETGYMSNRSRIVAANFFAAELKMDWRIGAAHYESCLIDYDVCSNWVNWLVAANLLNEKNLYLHVVKQSIQLDPDGDYIRRWVPEVAALPSSYIHRPWIAPSEVLERCGVVFDVSYPEALPGKYLRR